MNKTNEALRNWAINKIEKEYKEDIALLVAIHGFSVNGDGHGECFDYFVPATGRGYELSQTFIIDGVGTDLYGRSWERVEATADFEDFPSICLSQAEIVYSRSIEDEERFLKLKNKMLENLSNKQFMYEKCLEKLDMVMNLYSTMVFKEETSEIRMAAGYIAMNLATSISYLNGKCQDIYEKAMLETLTDVPDGFAEDYDKVFHTVSCDELKSLIYTMISKTRTFISNHRPTSSQNIEANYEGLADWYQELSLTLRRLRYYCEISNYEGVYTNACYIQSELGITSSEFGLDNMDILDAYDPNNLGIISKRSSEIENYIISVITGHGISLNRFDSVEDFLKKDQKE